MGASPASAAPATIPATAVTAAPPTQVVAVGGTVTVTGTITPVNSNATIGLEVTSGPDAAGTTAVATCTNGGAVGVPFGSYRCSFTTAAASAATDTIVAFADNDGNGLVSAGDVSASPVTVTIVTSTPYRAAFSPASAHAATNTCTSNLIVTVTDSSGQPIPGIALTVTATDTAAVAPTPTFCGEASEAAPSAPSGTTPNIVVTRAGTTFPTNAAGQTPIGIMSDQVGTVTLTETDVALAVQNLAPNLATVTIDAGGANSVTPAGLTAAPSTQTVFPGGNTVTVGYALANTQGDPVGNVPGGTSAAPVNGINGQVTAGPDAGRLVTCTTPSGTGLVPVGTAPGAGTCTYTTVSTATVPDTGTDSVQLWVNQSAGTTSGPDSGEPAVTSSVTLVAQAAFNRIVSSCDTALLGVNGCLDPTSTNSQVVTFTLTANGSNLTPQAGVEIDVTAAGLVGPLSGAPFTLSAPSCVTASDGTCTITVTDPTPTDTDRVQLTATVHGHTTDSLLTDSTSRVTWQVPQASTIIVTPQSATNTLHTASTARTATVFDQFDTPVANVSLVWSVAGRNGPGTNPTATGTCLTGAGGTCTTGTYTDLGGPIAIGQQTLPANIDTISVADPSAVLTTATAKQYWVPSGGVANNLFVKANSGAVIGGGDCGALPAGTGWTPTTATVTVSATTTTPAAVACVGAVDANSQTVFGQPITVTSSGVGQLLVVNRAVVGAWTSSGTSASVATEDGTAIFPAGTAIVGAQSTVPGTQTITFTAGSTVTASVTIVYSGNFAPLTTPTRLIDTRNGTGALAVNGTVAPVGAIVPGAVYEFDAAQTNVVPVDASAYAFNVTVVNPSARGNLRIYPCSLGLPTTSTVNFQPGADTANAAIVSNPLLPFPNGGAICLEASGGSTNVVIDATGYFAADLVAVTPARLYDSRNAGNSPIAANGTTAVQVGGIGGVPASGVKAVAINVTAITPTGGGNLSVYPDGATAPVTSNINYVTGVTKANMDVVALPADGKLDLRSAGSSVNVAVDIIGYWTTASPLQVQTPVRILDTRPGSGIGTLTGRLNPGTTANFTVTGAPGTGLAAVGASSVFGNLTAAYPLPGVGNLSVYPAGSSVPTASSINYVGGSPVANFAMTGVGTGGALSLVTQGSSTYTLYDLAAWYPAGS